MDRRKKTDAWAMVLICLNILAGILLILILLVFHLAQPEFETMFDRFYKLDIRTDWNIQCLHYLIYLIVLIAFISFSSLLLGSFRGRRKNDHSSSLILIIIGIIFFIMLGVIMILL
ncbi:hypothetical protein SAMN04487931_103131 [Desulfobacula phenolica]|uniref:Uncharacterized protein n=1 Tax=Desulfobacula phenolica TaxID=90732 RepID=A0A1H2EHY0_9BACT|nr:hypothetical protein SAMN04487931_103131 [Desulfobacula phenolica]